MKRTKSRTHQAMYSSTSSQSFKTGNMLTHPQGFQKFIQKSSQVLKEKQSQKDIQMLRKTPEFKPTEQEIRRYSSEISSEIENPQSQVKFYKYEKRLKYVNQQPVIFQVKIWLHGQETSQLEDVDGSVSEYLKMSEKKIEPQVQKKEQNKMFKRNRMMTETEKDEMMRREYRIQQEEMMKKISRLHIDKGTDRKKAFFIDD